MNFAIIAAGNGSRLAQEGLKTPKPLVQVAGEPLLSRLLNIFVRQQADSISVIVNEEMTEVQQYLERWKLNHREVALKVLVRSTPSSMHSLFALCDLLPQGPFVCTTVDTIFNEREFSAYASAFAQSPGEFLFGVTSYVEDEKPLWIDVDGQGMISAFSDQGPAPFVSGGIYGMNREVILPILQKCLSEGQCRMRNFQRALLLAGVKIRAYEFGKIMDIDHLSDIETAERWLSELHPNI